MHSDCQRVDSVDKKSSFCLSMLVSLEVSAKLVLSAFYILCKVPYVYALLLRGPMQISCLAFCNSLAEI